MSDTEHCQELLPIQKRIKELEDQYKELNSNLQISKIKVYEDEHALLGCLQQLMPVQNAYLSGIIQTLQKQLTPGTTVKSEPVDMTASSSTSIEPHVSRIRSRKNDVISNE